MILSQAIIADVVPARERGRYMGIMGGVFAISSVAGPLLGGWFTEGPGWRWGCGSTFRSASSRSSRRLLPPPAGRQQGGPKWTSLGWACFRRVNRAWCWWPRGVGRLRLELAMMICLMVATVVAGWPSCSIERRAAEPIMPLHLFRERNFNLTTTVRLDHRNRDVRGDRLPPDLPADGHRCERDRAGLLMMPLMARCWSFGRLRSVVSRFGPTNGFPSLEWQSSRLDGPALHDDPDIGDLDAVLVHGDHGSGFGNEHADPHPDRAEHLPRSQVGTATPRTTTSDRSAQAWVPQSSAACSSPNSRICSKNVSLPAPAPRPAAATRSRQQRYDTCPTRFVT